MDQHKKERFEQLNKFRAELIIHGEKLAKRDADSTKARMPGMNEAEYNDAKNLSAFTLLIGASLVYLPKIEGLHAMHAALEIIESINAMASLACASSLHKTINKNNAN